MLTALINFSRPTRGTNTHHPHLKPPLSFSLSLTPLFTQKIGQTEQTRCFLGRERERDHVVAEATAELPVDRGLQRGRNGVVRVHRRRPGRDAAHLPELLPLLHAGGYRSRKPPPRPSPPPFPPGRHRLLLLLLRSRRHPDPHLHLLLRPQNPRHRARLPRRPPPVQ